MVLTESLSFPYCRETLPPPKLVESLTGRSGEVCLHYLERISMKSETEPKAGTPVKQPSVRIQSTASVDLDITGSPLKAGFDPNEVFDDSNDDVFIISKKAQAPIFSGLPVKSSRTLLSRLNIAPTEPNATNLVLCRTDAASNLLYLGNRVEDGRLAEISTITWDGPVTAKSLTGALETFARTHSSVGARGRTQVCSRAEYLLTGGEEWESSLVLECSWDRSTALLETPPPDATTKLRVTFGSGDDRFACDKQNLEIEQLEGLISGLSGEGLVWIGREEDTSLEDEVLEVLEASRKLRPSSGPQESEQENLLSLQSRQDVDITDMLWTVLSGAQSFSELTDALNLVFETVQREELRPFIYSGNRSGMAGLLRDLVRSGNLPDLSGSKPLTLLVEMGIEKLKRDSSHYLLSSDLASKEAVDPFLSGDSLQAAVELLKRLHMVVELSFACQTYLSLPTSALKSLVHSALLQFRKLETIDKVQLEFPIQTSDVKSQLEKGRAGFWQLRFESEDVVSVAQLQVDKPEEIYPAPAAPVPEEEGDQAEPHYYILYYTQIRQEEGLMG